jgi:rhomboid protease GluP
VKLATLRARLKHEIRSFPATSAFCALWLVVFGLMLVDQAMTPGGLTWGQSVLGLRNGHAFGDVRLVDLSGGEVWRALTATFVHFGLLHVALNLYALYQLGAVVESWYGSGPFAAIYVLTGGGGNLLAGLARWWLGESPWVACAGGSTVVMGLAALAAVAGWRSGTLVGRRFARILGVFIGLTALLGAAVDVFAPIFELSVRVDNCGHAGGALIGAVIGLAQSMILRHLQGRRAALAGWAATGVILASTAALVADDRDESTRRAWIAEQARQRLVRDAYVLSQLGKVRSTYRAIARPRAMRRGAVVRLDVRPIGTPSPASSRATPVTTASGGGSPLESPATVAAPSIRIDAALEFDLTVLSASVRLFDSLRHDLESGPGSADYAHARSLLTRTLIEPPTFDEIRAFDDDVAGLESLIEADRRLAAASQAAALGSAPLTPGEGKVEDKRLK